MKKTILAILLASSFTLSSQAVEIDTTQAEIYDFSEKDCKDKCGLQYHEEKRNCINEGLHLLRRCERQAHQNYSVCKANCDLGVANTAEELSL